VQLLQAQIPKVQKDNSSHQCLIALLGSLQVKALSKTIVKLAAIISAFSRFYRKVLTHFSLYIIVVAKCLSPIQLCLFIFNLET